MSSGINIDEYVSEMLAISEGPIFKSDLAEGIADIAMAQGHYEGREFEDVVKEIEGQLDYYL